MSTSGPEWVENFQKFRSGTHNAQWFVVDYKQYRSQLNNLQNLTNVVWVAEE